VAEPRILDDGSNMSRQHLLHSIASLEDTILWAFFFLSAIKMHKCDKEELFAAVEAEKESHIAFLQSFIQAHPQTHQETQPMLKVMKTHMLAVWDYMDGQA
jgi:hypothetical protein